MLVGSGSSYTNNADNKLADQHSQGTPNHDCATTETFDDPEREGRGAHIDQCGNQINQEWIRDSAELLEEGSSEARRVSILAMELV